MSWLPPFLLPIAAGIFIAFGTGPNTGLAAISLSVLLVGAALLWRPGETPILLYVFAYQWLEASISIFYANFDGVEIDRLAFTGADIYMATFLSLIGLLALSFGMRLSTGRQSLADTVLIHDQLARRPVRSWLLLYVSTFVAATAALALARVMPGLSQPLLALANFKWAAFVIFTFATFVRPDGNMLAWFAVFAVEFLLSIGGYFSSFKSVFIFTLIGLAACSTRLSISRVAGLAIVAVVAVCLGIVWSAIKQDYRQFVSDGAAAQVVTVSRGAQIGKLVELTLDLDFIKLQDGLDGLVRRIAYVEFFGASLNYVPSIVPHTYGDIWYDAITRPFMPRILFPEKSVIDESANTTNFTGLAVAGFNKGTQISIGYIGDTYIDFGEFGMMLALIGLGFALGRIYVWLNHARNSRGLLGMGLSSAILIPTGGIGISAPKMFGAVAVSILVAWLLSRIAVPVLMPWLLEASGRRR